MPTKTKKEKRVKFVKLSKVERALIFLAECLADNPTNQYKVVEIMLEILELEPAPLPTKLK